MDLRHRIRHLFNVASKAQGPADTSAADQRADADLMAMESSMLPPSLVRRAWAEFPNGTMAERHAAIGRWMKAPKQ